MMLFFFIPVVSQETADRLYQSALYKEEVEGNLTEAIKLYKQVIEKSPKNAPTAAKALFQLGFCHERLEDANEAIASYQKILDHHADQKDIASRAKERLTLLLKEKELRDSKAIAVLPFKNMNEDKENEFFSDGITEDIITQLSKISEFRVISRSSTMQYKNSPKHLPLIGRDLGVGHLVEGSVFRSGDRVRISAHLVKTSTDEHLWAETYDKEMTEIFAIQTDVAKAIAAALNAKLSPSEKDRLEKKPTGSLDAYAYYVKGREYFYWFRKQDNEYAIQLFKKALEFDPNYALAYAGLADAYSQRVYSFGFSGSWIDSAIVMSTKAIAIDSNSAEGYKALGLAFASKGWSHRALEAEYRAVKLNPSHHAAVHNIGTRVWGMGQIAEGLQWLKKAHSLEPSFPMRYVAIGNAYRALDDDTKAEQWYRRASEIQPDFDRTYVAWAQLYLIQGKYKEALAMMEQEMIHTANRARALNTAGNGYLLMRNYDQAKQSFERAGAIDSTAVNLSSLGYVYWKIEKQDEARELFKRARTTLLSRLDEGDERDFVPFEIARIEAAQNRKAQAYSWLQKAIDAGWRNYRWGLIDPLLQNLQNDEQLKQMMAQVKAMVDLERMKAQEWEKQEKSNQ
ncbi:MAG: tetratricopeptide repeat protein [Ignavibacteriales bacterium]|nr:tetratricopeptide repeat protein [Ignavibacteriales bacterium]